MAELAPGHRKHQGEAAAGVGGPIGDRLVGRNRPRAGHLEEQGDGVGRFQDPEGELGARLLYVRGRETGLFSRNYTKLVLSYTRVRRLES